jgi:hypothetical protein
MQKLWRINTNTEQVCRENQDWESVITKGHNNLESSNQAAASNATREPSNEREAQSTFHPQTLCGWNKRKAQMYRTATFEILRYAAESCS